MNQTINQLPLPLAEDLKAKAEAFDTSNPHVWETFERHALAMFTRGKKVGQRAVWERMRWDLNLRTEGDEYKLNNNHTAYYARKFNLRHGEYFRTRQRT